jgi:hypothetical protein
MLRLFKNQLQTYAQKRNFTLPVYSCERVGLPHAIQFKCKVTVNGQTYESREYFPTLSKAENAAAKAALMSLLPNGGEEVIFLINSLWRCKNLLVTLAIFVFVSFRHMITLLYVIYCFLFRMSLAIRIFYKKWLGEKVVVYQLILQRNLVKLMRLLSFQKWR